MREVVFGHNRVSEETDYDGGYGENLGDLIFDYGCEHGFHCEGREHIHGAIADYREVHLVNKPSDFSVSTFHLW